MSYISISRQSPTARGDMRKISIGRSVLIVVLAFVDCESNECAPLPLTQAFGMVSSIAKVCSQCSISFLIYPLSISVESDVHTSHMLEEILKMSPVPVL